MKNEELTKLMSDFVNFLEEHEDPIGEAIKEYKNGKGEDFPEEYDTYFYVDEYGYVGKREYFGTDWDKANKDLGNCFKAENEAEMHKLRLQSMAQRGEEPKNGDVVWYYNFCNCKVEVDVFDKQYPLDYWIGNYHKTKEEAEAWYEKFGEAFEL